MLGGGRGAIWKYFRNNFPNKVRKSYDWKPELDHIAVSFKELHLWCMWSLDPFLYYILPPSFFTVPVQLCISNKIYPLTDVLTASFKKCHYFTILLILDYSWPSITFEILIDMTFKKTIHIHLMILVVLKNIRAGFYTHNQAYIWWRVPDLVSSTIKDPILRSLLFHALKT